MSEEVEMKVRVAVCLAFSLGVAGSAAHSDQGRVDSFRPLGRFLVPGGGSAEIVSATPDGRLVVYTSAASGRVGIVDLASPRNPRLLTEVEPGGEPTSVAVTPDGRFALVCVITSVFVVGQPPTPTPGKLLVLRLPDGTAAGSVALGEHPDSVAATEIGGRTVAVVAIENQPMLVDEMGNFVAGDAPGDPRDRSPKGLVQVVTLNFDSISDSTVADVRFDDEAALTALGLPFPADPQPEYVSIQGHRAAATLQENNALAIIDISDPAHPALESLFSLGTAADRPSDLTRNAVISLSESYPSSKAASAHAGARMSDAVAWNAAGTALFTADEGELNFTGGRGFSARRPDGAFLWDDGGSLEVAAVRRGHFPELRAAARGIETEGIATGVFGRKEFAFVTSERGGFVAVYEVTDPLAPRFVQLLPAGWRPEQALPVPARNLLLTADEGPDGAGTISIFAGVQGRFIPPANRPLLVSPGLDHPWAALSGLAADLRNENVLYAVPDSALVSSIFRIDLLGPAALIRSVAPVMREDKQAAYDLEGIALDTSIEARHGGRGFWLAAEGNARFGASNYLPNLLVQVDSSGRVRREIRLPDDIDPPAAPASTDGKIQQWGFEGVAVSSSGRHLLAAIQRELAGEEAVGGRLHTRIARYDLRRDVWEFFLYPLEVATVEDGWVGLSEIINLGGDRYAVIERDNQLGGAAAIKQVYSFSLSGVKPFSGAVTAGSDLRRSVIRKKLMADLLEEFTPFEKIEGLAVTREGRLWAVLDNDGGQIESRLVQFGRDRSDGEDGKDDDDK